MTKAATKATHQTDRRSISRLDEIVNIGPATADLLTRMGYKHPQDLLIVDGDRQQSPPQLAIELYRAACRLDRKFYDPCVLDVFAAAVDYMNGSPPLPWWKYTAQRKERYSDEIEKARKQYA